MKSSALWSVLISAMLAGCSGDDAAPADPCPGEAPPPPPDLDPVLEARVDALLAEMTLVDKVGQMHGYALSAVDGLWITEDNDRLGIPGFHMTDGPRGVYAGHSTAFPVAMARGASFDRALEEAVGEAIALEARGHGADVLLAPTVNVLRHPAWGRAQETYGEDSFHIGELGVAFVVGAQRHIIATAKHFAGNSIEDTRFDVDVQIEERALHEVYLPHFEKLVSEAKVGAVMSAYNQVNGAYASENPTLLRDILKDGWGFPGLVMSDWIFGTHSAANSVNAGLDIEMPAPLEFEALRREAERCEVSTATLDDAVRRILRTKLRFGLDDPTPVDPAVIESAEHAALALRAARASMVLLRNQADVLPLDPAGDTTIAVVGALGAVANIGDVGSSNVFPTRTVTPLDGLRTRLGAARIVNVTVDALDDGTRLEVAGADAAVVVVGLTAEDEGESIPGRPGGDRDSLALSAAHQALIAEVAAANPRTIVVIEAGSAVLTAPWIDDVEAVLLAWYPGQEGGTALAELLVGDVSPSGRLPLTMPVAEADLPPFDHTSAAVEYGLLHGYTWVDHEAITPAFPFGFGLSYGDVTYDSAEVFYPLDPVEASVRVTITLTSVDRTGDEVVQVYVEPPAGTVDRPVRRLAGFERVSLTPGQTVTVDIEVPIADLARYDAATDTWITDPGDYALVVGPSSRELPLRASFSVD